MRYLFKAAWARNELSWINGVALAMIRDGTAARRRLAAGLGEPDPRAGRREDPDDRSVLLQQRVRDIFLRRSEEGAAWSGYGAVRPGWLVSWQ